MVSGGFGGPTTTLVENTVIEVIAVPMSERSPSEIARETLKLLSARRLLPSPENYQALWHEIAGTRVQQPFPAEHLRRIAEALPSQLPGQKETLIDFDKAVESRSWVGLQKSLINYANLANTALAAAPERAPELPPMPRPTVLTAELREQVARLVDALLPALSSDDARLAAQANDLANSLRQSTADVNLLKSMMGNFSFRLSFVAEEQASVRTALLECLNLIFRNIGELSLEDKWLKGQVDALMTAAAPPVTLRRLDELQVRLKDVISKQSQAKERTLAAQAEMKQMLAMFVERLSKITDASSIYQAKIDTCAKQIDSAATLEEAKPMLQEALAATRSMARDVGHTRDELRSMRERTVQAEIEIHKLQQELDRVSAQARHDPLTGALNRKGMDESMDREVATARRRDTPLCVALLDIDNFKKINDSLGHEGGDAALLHLADVARASMRPQDSLSRFGGEEFVIIMPDTSLPEGIEAMTRLQRELTKRFFLRGNEKVLITFSAGVAQLGGEESGNDAIRRADQGMYLAKRSGKNRVVGA